MSVLRNVAEQALARLIARLCGLPEESWRPDAPPAADPMVKFPAGILGGPPAPYVPPDMPKAYDGREQGAAKITHQALSDSVLEGLKEDLEELGLVYEPKVAYNVREVQARAGHRRADRQLTRSEAARVQLVIGVERAIVSLGKDDGASGDEVVENLREVLALAKAVISGEAPTA